MLRRLTVERFNELQVGDWIADMHYGIEGIEKDLDEHLAIGSHVTMLSDKGSEFIENSTKKNVTNKFAYVVGSWTNMKVFAYSYDHNFFGMFKITLK